MGHEVKSSDVEGTYDRHHYTDEKSAALEQLAALIERITNPPSGDNVVSIRRTAAAG